MAVYQVRFFLLFLNGSGRLGMRSVLLILLCLLISYRVKGEEVRDVFVIDTFSGCISQKNGLPCGWHPTQRTVEMFSVQKSDGNHYVKIKTRGGNTTIGCKIKGDISEYPFLCWKWRIHRLPSGAREDVKWISDSGAGVYVIFRGTLRLNRIIKYVWSSTLPEGTVTESPFNGRAKIKVLRSGEGLLGSWVNEKVNVKEDYIKLFGSEPPDVEAIAIMSDADNTRSFVEADYDDFWISRF